MPLYGKGVEIEETADEVIIRFKKDNDFGLSATGKNRMVASTSGNVSLPCGIVVGLNAYRRQ